MTMIPFKEPNNLSELIVQISERPALFVGWNDYSRVTSFIEGYVYARRKFEKSNEIELLNAFSLWLSEKLNKPKNWAWSRVIEDYYKNDEVALKKIPELFKEFLSQNPKSLITC